jgi:hypothetical protein
MILAEQKLNTFRSIKTNEFIQPKDFPINLSKHSEVITSIILIKLNNFCFVLVDRFIR